MVVHDDWMILVFFPNDLVVRTLEVALGLWYMRRSLREGKVPIEIGNVLSNWEPGTKNRWLHCGWARRNPATTKRMVETCWNPINNGILAIYQLVQDFATIRRMSSLCDCFLYPKTGESASWAQTRFRGFWLATLVANLLLFGGVHGEGSV